jgi:hypothetical protein
MSTLLEKAKAKKQKASIGESTSEQVELALAWVRGEITIGQVCAAIDKPSTGSYGQQFLCKILKDYILSIEREAKK